MTFTFPVNINAVFGENFEENVRQKIIKYRQTQDLSLFDQFKFEKFKHPEHGLLDKNFYEREILTLILSTDFQAVDKPLIRWLIIEFCKNSQAGFWVDLRSVMALLGFMLYKHMENSDILWLYKTKFEACSDSYFSVDAEIVMGLGQQQTFDYLSAHKKSIKKYKTIAKTLKTYLDERPNISLRSYDEYCQFFENYRFASRQEEIATDCGLIED